MKSLVFDSSAVISLATNNLLWTLEPLRKKFKGDFYISGSVKEELIDNPIKGKKFRLEAMMILELLGKGILKIKSNLDVERKTKELLELANHIFETKNEYMHVVHGGEMESLVLVKELKADAYVIDERTTRLLVESPSKLAGLLFNKIHSRVNTNQENLNEFKNKIGDVDIIRSTELMVSAFDFGLLDKYVSEKSKKFISNNLRKNLLEGLLWGLKLRGCSISGEEINEIIKVKGF